MNIAIIPARSGSKRIKNKNIKLFHKKPIIYYSIIAAKKSKLFSEIYVSTNSNKIKNISKKFGAKILNRPNNFLSGDKAEIMDVISYETKKLKTKIKKKFNVCCIFPASPFIKPDDLIKSFKLLVKKNFTYVFAVSKVNTNIQRTFELSSNNKLKKFNIKNMKKRSQEFRERYFDIGQFYFASSDAWIKKKKVISKKSGVIKINPLYDIDINNKEDFNKAEKIYKIKN